MLSKLIIWMFCISFAEIIIAVTRLGVTLIRGGSSPLIPSETSTVGICPSVLFVYWIIKQEMFHLTFQEFIFTRCMSTIYLILLTSWGTMRCLAPFFKLKKLFVVLSALDVVPVFLVSRWTAWRLVRIDWGSYSVSTEPPGAQFVYWLNVLGSNPQMHALKIILLTKVVSHSAIFISSYLSQDGTC